MTRRLVRWWRALVFTVGVLVWLYDEWTWWRALRARDRYHRRPLRALT